MHIFLQINRISRRICLWHRPHVLPARPSAMFTLLWSTGTRAPLDFKQFNVSLNFRAAQSDSDFVHLTVQTYLYSATAAASLVATRWTLLIQCIISRHFVCDEKFHVALCPLAPDPVDATGWGIYLLYNIGWIASYVSRQMEIWYTSIRYSVLNPSDINLALLATRP